MIPKLLKVVYAIIALYIGYNVFSRMDFVLTPEYEPFSGFYVLAFLLASVTMIWFIATKPEAKPDHSGGF